MVFEELRKSTRAHHLKIKNGKYAKKIMQGVLTLDEYKVLIAANYFFHGTLEKQIFEQVPRFVLDAIDFEKRNKVPYLIHDLMQLGIDVDTLNIKTKKNRTLPSLVLTTEAKALAALYVAEGTAIGGAIIKKNLLKIEALDQLSFSFYGCYGDSLSAKWKTFSKVFNDRCEVKKILEKVIADTEGIFNFYEACITYCEPILLGKKKTKGQIYTA